MQQELHYQTGTTGTTNFAGKRPLRRFIASFISAGLILLGLPAMAQPTVTSLSTLIGYQGAAITITGTGFNATPANNTVYFGATKATVSAGSTTSLSVTVPRGTTYMPVSVLNTATNLQAYSPQAFLQGFSPVGFASGTINFDPHFDFAAGTNPSGVAFGDMDGDGKPDMVVANTTSRTIAIYKNNTTVPGPITGATFAAPVTFSTGAIQPYILTLGDIDGDGKLDVAAGALTGTQVLVMLNTTILVGTPLLGPVTSLTAANLPYAVALGDLDGDGKIDLASANAGANTISLFRNTSTPGVVIISAATSFATGGGSQPVDVAIQDIDGDGRRDVSVVNYGSSRLSVFKNNMAAPGAFSAATLTAATNFVTLATPQYLVVGDMDGDGKADVVVGSKSSSPSAIAVFRNTSVSGTVTLTSCTTQAALQAEGIAVGDFDGDGRPDLVVTNLGDSSVSVYRNNSSPGVCSFGSQCIFKTSLTFSSGAAYVAAGDLDNDGLSDLAVTNYNGATVSVFRNDPLQAIQPVGGLQVCACSTDSAQFTEAALGGTWTSSNPLIAVIDTFNGKVTGACGASGTATITYNSGCGFTTTTVTVNPTPTCLTGPNIVCIGTTITLNACPAGGVTFLSLYTGVATVGSSSGVVTGVSPGFDTVVAYIGIPACRLVQTLNVFNPPVAITGILTVCVGSTTQLTNTSGGGVWSLSNGNATITPAGLVTGVTAGTVIVTYGAIASGCTATAILTINPLPAAITGTLSVCQGLTTTLSSTTAGGTWSSSNGNATVTVGPSSTTTVTGVLAGTAVITYTLPTGCIRTTTVTVNPPPTAILGTLTVCIGLSTTLSDAGGAGTWVSSNFAVATITSPGGVASGVGAGTSTITYTQNSSGCFTTAVLTVNPNPSAITGTLTVCQGLTTSLSSVTAGGTWASSSGNVSVVLGPGSSTVATGNTAGTATITYTLPTGCIAPTVVVTVNPLPPAITGTLSVCVGLTTPLTDATAGGTWTSSNTGVATVTASGVVTGVAAGTATIVHTSLAGCVNTGSTIVTVNPLPAALTGGNTVCVGLTTTFSSTTAGGTWTSGSPANASVDAFGVIIGLAPGGTTATITYTLPTGCIATRVVSVNPLPTAINGTLTVCVGATTQLTDGTAGGAWTSGSTGIATISGLGLVTGVSPGTSIITYTVGTGCIVTAIVTVNPIPTTINGVLSVCVGLTTQLTDGTVGGTWASSLPGTAPVVSGTGVVTGAVAGTATISYILSTGCYITAVVTVNPNPGSINGTRTVCEGLTTTLTDASAGGTWSSSNANVTITGGGVATGAICPGTSTITYTMPTTCINTAVVTVNCNPAPITSISFAVCQGLTTPLTDATLGGTWSTSNAGVATVSGTGIVSGVVTGSAVAATATITYTMSSGCFTTATVTVNPLPTAINGGLVVCQGLCTSLSDGTAGGTWSSSNPLVGTVSAAGVACGVITGSGVQATTTITYTLGTGCIVTAVLSVNPLPTPINGTLTVCVGLTSLLTDGTAGGTWTSSIPVIATITSGGGLVTGVAPGTTTITYSIGTTGCITTAIVTVNPNPSAILGTLLVCQGASVTLSDLTGGGTWSVSNANTTITAGGVVTGVTCPASSVVTYTLPTSCIATATMAVSCNPTPIGGTLTVCVGLTTNLTSTPGGGTWMSSNVAVATVSSTGVVTGITGGFTTTITYTVPSGCFITAVVTVNPLPAAITGTLTVCQGLTTQLTDATAGGTWLSSVPAVATVSGSGLVTAVITGSPSIATTTITYTLPTGCIMTTVVTVNPLPGAILGTRTVCEFANTQLSDATPFGTWSITPPGNATVSPGGGLVTGLLANTTATVTYTLPSSCIATAVVTINPNPAAISGTPVVCQGLCTPLTDITPGGTWSSSNITNATVGLGTGIMCGVTGFSTVTITYTLGTGCFSTVQGTVNPLPTPINGNLNVCQGLTTSLSDATPGGTWSSSIPAVATVDAFGNVTGILTGSPVAATSTITYTLATGCIITAVVTVNPLPGPINGNLAICSGLCSPLSDATPLGTWSSSNISVATVGVGTGLTCAIASLSIPVTATITYTLPTSCLITAVVTVNPLPNNITGPTTVCVNSTIALTDVTLGGTWSSSNPLIGSVDPVTGIVGGILAGTVTITYTLPTSCIATYVVTVNPLPTPILGTLTVCVGSQTQLSDATIGGTWTSSTPANASVVAATGLVTGNTASTTATITYTLPTTCSITAVVTVNPLPLPIVPSPAQVCVGSVLILTDASLGGVWSSSNTGIATVGSGTGAVTGVTQGIVLITYQLATGCVQTAFVTVNPLPAPISGTPVVCQGSCITLSDATPGGTWSSDNVTDATVGSASGLVCGVLGSTTATISYTLISTGCSQTVIVTVNPIPAPINGALTVCVGYTTLLTDVTPGGAWFSSNPAVASVPAGAGSVLGLSTGTTNITYEFVATGCMANVIVTVNPVPGPINGTLTVCQGLTTLLTDATSGGTWSSGNPATATVGSGTGVVTGGVTTGTATISYVLGTGCYVTADVTVNPNPAPIVGGTGVCIGATIALTDITPGGTWTTSNPSIGTVSSTGVVTGIASGSINVTYALPTGCNSILTVNVSSIPPPITGTTSICLGSSVLLTDLLAGGTWSSSNPAVATVDPFGVTTGTGVGTATITYAPPTGCVGTIVVTVYPTPAIPTGSPLFVCVGLTTTLNDATPGGTWSSGDPTIGTVVDVTGVVTGVSGGTVVISYTMPTYCYSTVIVTVNNNPGAINGNANVCLGGSTILASGPPGGTWSATSGTGSVSFPGSTTSPVVVVTGATLGTATVTYTMPTGCIATVVVTINPNPLPVTGTAVICVGGTTALTSATTGGTWSSGASGVATVTSSGLVTGVGAGTAAIIYTGAGGCTSTLTVTVNPLPPAITGVTTVCMGFTTQLSNTSPGGTWSSSNPGNASIDALGLVTGVTGNSSATITYTSAAGCIATVVVSVNDTPTPIIGSLSICIGATVNLTDAAFGGTWISNTPAVASIGFFTGVTTGLTAGTSVITYAFSTGCYTTSVLTVNPNPTAILGNLGVCEGATTQLTDATGGGVWSISNSNATIDVVGLVTGVTAGTATVSYTSAAGCFATATVTVYPIPAPITGTLSVCEGLTTTLSDATAGGTWASSDVLISTIDISSGIATGISAGTVTDTYTIAFGCYVTAVLTVNPLPAAISGPLAVCVGLTTTLSDAITGGTWSASSATITIGSSSGVVTGVSVGTATATYTLPTGCIMTAVVTVNPLPQPISGNKVLCAGTTTALTDTTTGGIWTSSAPGIGTIDPSTGVFTGISGGTTIVTYTLSTGCINTAVITVNPVPANISGTLVVCVGATTTLTDATGGGFWYSSIPPLATIGSSSGIVTGVSAGTVEITYILPSPTGCQTTAILTVNPIPAPINGASEICVFTSTLLTDASPGGVWSAASVLISGGSATGLVYGGLVGTGTSTYTFPATGCYVTHIVTVDPLPAPISGTLEVCVGLTTTLSDDSLGGTWSTASAAIATITSAGGVATGVAAGTTDVTYTSAQGCVVSAVLTVDPLPTPILGSSAVCIGATMTLSDLTAGGTWSSSDALIAPVSSGGVVSGNNLGTATITYTIPTGCYVTRIVTVNKVPANILGNLTVCVGLTTLLSDTTAGGVWSSSTGAIGTIGSTSGVVMGISGGTTTITYSVATSCFTTAIVTVNPLPSAILGSRDLCIGFTSALSDLAGGGTWSSSDTNVATIGSGTGIVFADTVGTATITYTLPTGCITTAVVTVYPIPAPISGSNKVCLGATVTLSDITPGGLWSSSNPSIAPVTSGGVVTGLSIGTATITYSPAVGCVVTVTMTVNPNPAPFTIFGGGSYCQGGAGVPIGLDGSNVGISYLLFYDSSATGFLAGTGDTLNFGLLTVPGTYTVLATGTTSGCMTGMTGSVSVVVIPTVNPTVTIVSNLGDTVCPGTSVTFSVIATPAGTMTTTPTFMWSVNGTNVSTASTYTFIPANGDVVKVIMNSGAICIFPTAAMDTLRMVVRQIGVPLVNVTVDPGDTVCEFASATYTATPTFGGYTPQYTWIVNNAVAGTGSVFSYAPAEGDVVYVKMLTSYQCATTDTAYSNVVHMHIMPLIIPHIDIVPHPGFSVVEGQPDTLTTVIANAGSSPTYQWLINGVPVPGATNATYISSSFHNYDSVTCMLTSSGYCAGISTFDWVYITVIPVGVHDVQYVGVGDIRLIPNPTSGAVTVKGTLSTTVDEELHLEVTDMLGQIVYRSKFRSDKGKINEQVLLGDNLANGMYILNISSGSDNKAFHFVLER